MTKLIGISGSLRQGSFNSALLQAAAGLAPGGTELTRCTLPRFDHCVRLNVAVIDPKGACSASSAAALAPFCFATRPRPFSRAWCRG